jgi:cytochrome b
MDSDTNHRTATRSVLVWDLPTRLFHWLLFAAVSFALATGLFAPKWWLGRHMFAGYVVGGLLVFRTVWALCGSEHSRVRSFLYGPRQTIEHLRGLLRLRRAHYIGHNPSGAAMIFALFGVLVLLTVTGFLQQGGLEKQGPFAGFLSYALGIQARVVHQFLAYLLLGLIALHLAGVLFGSWFLKEPLIRAMIGGRKPLPVGLAGKPPAPARPWLAALCLVLIGGTVAVSLALMARVPPLGLPAMPENRVMLDECGACHHSFHPSLLPRASWALLMKNLGNHFSEDASLPATEREEIAEYLSQYAAEAWDTRAAHLFSLTSADSPFSITATPAWQRIHRKLTPAQFAAPQVRARSNCIACHGDADSGRFDPQATIIPKAPTT